MPIRLRCKNDLRGMALIGMAFGLGFTFGPLLGLLAVPAGQGDPGPLPGFVAAGLSAVALGLAWFLLPESLHDASERATQHVFDWRALRTAMSIPSIGPLILAVFVCVFSFANFETTLGLLIKGETDPPVFDFSFRRVCLTFAYIGFVLAMVQGGLVRRLAGKVPEGHMAAAGAVGEVVGFVCLMQAVQQASPTWLMVGLTIVVAGFAFITPSLNSLISRRSDPHRQGGILGTESKCQRAGAYHRIRPGNSIVDGRSSVAPLFGGRPHDARWTTNRLERGTRCAISRPPPKRRR